MISEEDLTVLRDCVRLEFPAIPDIFFENMRFTVESQIESNGSFTTEMRFRGGASYYNEEAVLDAITTMPECVISSYADYAINVFKMVEFDGTKYLLGVFFYVAMPEEDVKFLMEMGNLVKQFAEREVQYGVMCDL